MGRLKGEEFLEDLYPFRNLMGLEFTESMLVVCC